MKKSLVALAVGTFSLGISEFGMMGILSDVASGVGVDIATAGHLVSAYSLGVAVGAPMLIAMRRLPLKRLMLLLSAVFRCRSNCMLKACRQWPWRKSSGCNDRRHGNSQCGRCACCNIYKQYF